MKPVAGILAVACCAMVSWAQVTFQAAADKVHATPGETIQITATLVTNKNLGTIRPPAVAPDASFDVLRSDQRSSHQSSIQITNGSTSKTDEFIYYFTYVIAPKKTGGFSFPALQVSIDGQSYSTQPIPMQVTAQAVSTAEMIARCMVAKRQLYAGEQTILTVYLGQKPNAPAQFTNPGLNQFVQNLEKSLSGGFSYMRLFGNNLPRVVQIIDGEQYNALKLTYAIFPNASGELGISSIPLEYEVVKRAQRRNIDPFFGDFDDFFGGVQAEGRTTASNRLSISVKALPPSPAGFSGAVGHFSLRASIDPQTVPAGEAVTCKVLLGGDTRPGNVGDIQLPSLSAIDVFPPEKQVRADTTANGVSTQKSYKCLLIPRQEGQVAIPAISFVYFDPDREAYQTLSSGAMTLTVTKGKEGARSQSRYLTQEDIRELGRDIRYIKTPSRITGRTDKPYRSIVFVALYPLPFLIALLALLYRLQSERKAREVVITLRRRALARAVKRLRTLEKRGAPLQPADFLSRLMDVIERYITDKFGFAAQGKTIEEMKLSLREWGAADETIGHLVRFIEDADAFRFGGSSQEGTSKSDMLRKAQDLVSRLDRETRKRPDRAPGEGGDL